MIFLRGSGAPLFAVLLWPAGRDPSASFVAGRPLGRLPARLLWLTLWGSMAFFAIQAGGMAPQGLHDMLSSMAAGEPGWIASIDHSAAALVAQHGPQVSAVLAITFELIAIGIFLPGRAARAAVILAVAAIRGTFVLVRVGTAQMIKDLCLCRRCPPHPRDCDRGMTGTVTITLRGSPHPERHDRRATAHAHPPPHAKASGYTHRRHHPRPCPLTCIAGVAQRFRGAPFYRFRACFTVLPCLGCCRFLRAGGRVQGREAPA
jgi:hypothetical protein